MIEPSSRPGHGTPTRRLVRRLAEAVGADVQDLAALGVLLASAGLAAAAVWWLGAPGSAAIMDPTPDQRTVTSEDLSPRPGDVVVHVAGAVAKPGVHVLSGGARVADAIAAAGGLAIDADTSGLNLARVLADGEQILVPTWDVGASTGSLDSGADGATDGPVDLNRASPSDLESLPGIGPVLAARIVAFRDEHGPFAAVGDLRKVPGIGERTFQTLAPLVRV